MKRWLLFLGPFIFFLFYFQACQPGLTSLSSDTLLGSSGNDPLDSNYKAFTVLSDDENNKNIYINQSLPLRVEYIAGSRPLTITWTNINTTEEIAVGREQIVTGSLNEDTLVRAKLSDGITEKDVFFKISTNPLPDLATTHIFMGSLNAIYWGTLDRTDDTFTLQTELVTNGEISWLQKDPKNNALFTSSLNGFHSYFEFDNDNLTLSLGQEFAGLEGSVHLNIVPLADTYLAFSSSYGNSVFSLFELDIANATSTELDSIDFSNLGDFLTHGSAYDEKNKLVYVANSGGNRVSVFQFANNKLEPISDITGIANPRNLLFSKKFDLLYVITETMVQSSEIYIYQTNRLEDGFEFKLLEKIELGGTYGSEIKIDNINNYIIATVRETDNSGIEFIPLDEFGISSKVKTKIFTPTLDHPRALDISEDGRYVFVNYNVPDQLDLAIFRTEFNNGNIVSVNQIVEMEVSDTSFLGNALIEISN